MKALKTLMVGVVLLSLSACAGMTPREQRVLSGAAIGAGAGAAIGAATGGSPAAGAAIGGAAGAVGGLVVDELHR
jgi:osmotically inducible lipoprotein OsmB